jgi:hypothetical protein
MEFMMPRFPRNTRLWCLTILMFSAFTVNALTLNPLIEAPDGHTIIDHEPLLFNEQIIFVTEKDDKHNLWAYDLISNEYLNLQHFDKNIIGKFYKIDDRFYFKENNEPSQIWQSDGTESGTQVVDGLFVGRNNSTKLYQQNNILFNRGAYSSYKMIFFDGSTIQRYLTPGEPYDSSVCAFNVNDVVIASKLSSGNYINMIRYHNDSQINYTSSLNQYVETNSSYTWFFDNTCFVYMYGEGLEDIMVIPEQGNHYFLGEKLGYLTASYLTQFKGYYYAVTTDLQNTKRIIKLSPDLSQVISNVVIGQVSDKVTLHISYNYLIASVSSHSSAIPYYWYAKYFDENLNEISGLGGSFASEPIIYLRDGGDTFRSFDFYNGSYITTLSTDITEESAGLDFYYGTLIDVITSKDDSETYTLVKDFQTGQSSIKKLDATPDMGSLSVGNWFDPDYQSQGVSIVEGERDDGSRYLFVTLYLFQDGEPLWLAGTSNISYPQPALDIELGAYSGPGLWQADTPANVEKFADMTLSMSSCHRMMLAMETEDGQSFNLELQRMVNKNIDHLCQD